MRVSSATMYQRDNAAHNLLSAPPTAPDVAICYVYGTHCHPVFKEDNAIGVFVVILGEKRQVSSALIGQSH